MSHHHLRVALRLSASSLAAVSLSVALASADPQKNQRSTDQVTVRGCLHGLVITTQDESGTNLPTPHKFRLTGDRTTLDALRKHSGHVEEVTGRRKAGKASAGVAVGEKRIEKGRVYIAAGSAPVYEGDPIPDSSIEVREFTHVNDRC
jgi:hypothetical protein